MTTNLNRVQKLIRMSRLLRPSLDCALLAACLCTYAVVQHHTISSKQDKAAAARLFQLLSKHASQAQRAKSMVSIEQQYESETAMWSGFQSWLEEGVNSSGHCSFSALNTESGLHLQCTASRRNDHGAGKLTDSSQPLVFSTLFAVKPGRSGEATGLPPLNPQVVRTPEKTYPVQGWVDTPSGRKQFDTRTKRWIP